MGYDDTRAARVHRSLGSCTRAARMRAERASAITPARGIVRVRRVSIARWRYVHPAACATATGRA